MKGSTILDVIRVNLGTLRQVYMKLKLREPWTLKIIERLIDSEEFEKNLALKNFT